MDRLDQFKALRAPIRQNGRPSPQSLTWLIRFSNVLGRSNVPIYLYSYMCEQVRRQMRARQLNVVPFSKSKRWLAKRFQVSLPTIQRAIRVLRKTGLIKRFGSEYLILFPNELRFAHMWLLQSFAHEFFPKIWRDRILYLNSVLGAPQQVLREDAKAADACQKLATEAVDDVFRELRTSYKNPNPKPRLKIVKFMPAKKEQSDQI
jgi:transposase